MATGDGNTTGHCDKQSPHKRSRFRYLQYPSYQFALIDFTLTASADRCRSAYVRHHKVYLNCIHETLMVMMRVVIVIFYIAYWLLAGKGNSQYIAVYFSVWMYRPYNPDRLLFAGPCALSFTSSIKCSTSTTDEKHFIGSAQAPGTGTYAIAVVMEVWGLDHPEFCPIHGKRFRKSKQVWQDGWEVLQDELHLLHVVD